MVLLCAFLPSYCLAISYEELPKGIEITGLIIGEEFYCSAKVFEHAVMDYQSTEFENTHSAVLRDSSGNEIEDYDFMAYEEKFGDYPLLEEGYYAFSIIVPYNENVATVSVLDNSADEKCVVVRSENNPSIQIVQPNNGGNWDSVEKIKWGTSDSDSGDLLLTDIYWADNSGEGWRLLKKDFSETELDLIDSVPATRLMLVVSDGFNIGVDVLESNAATGTVAGNIDFEETLDLQPIDPKTLISDDGTGYSPRVIDSNGNAPPKPPPKQDWIDYLIYIFGACIVIVGIAIAFSLVKGKKKK